MLPFDTPRPSPPLVGSLFLRLSYLGISKQVPRLSRAFGVVRSSGGTPGGCDTRRSPSRSAQARRAVPSPERLITYSTIGSSASTGPPRTARTDTTGLYRLRSRGSLTARRVSTRNGGVRESMTDGNSDDETTDGDRSDLTAGRPDGQGSPDSSDAEDPRPEGPTTDSPPEQGDETTPQSADSPVEMKGYQPTDGEERPPSPGCSSVPKRRRSARRASPS